MKRANDTTLRRRRTYAAPVWSADFLILRQIRAFVDPHLGRITGAQTVLDAGCGEQPLRRAIELAGARYVGLDVEQNRSGTVDVVCSLTDVPLDDESIDVIIATEVLEHVPDTAEAFAEMSRLLRKGGTIVMTTPFAYPLHEVPHDYVRLTTHGIERLAARSGLAVAELHALGNEIDVMTLTFCNLLSNVLTPLPFALRAALALVRLPLNAIANVLALCAGGALSRVLPRKSYLSTAAVLTK